MTAIFISTTFSSCGTSSSTTPKITTTTQSSGTEVPSTSSTSTTSIRPLPGRPAFDPQSLTFVSSSVGWAWGPSVSALNTGYGPGVLAKTNNYGITWSKVPTPGIKFYTNGSDTTYSYANGVRFANSDLGFLFGSSFYVTTNGGNSWHKEASPGTIYDIESGAGSVYALVNKCGISVSCGTATLYKIENNGTTFAQIDPSITVNWDSRLVVQGDKAYLLADPTNPGPSQIRLWRSTKHKIWNSVITPCKWSGANFGALAAWSTTGLVLVCGLEPGAGSQMKTAYYSTNSGDTWSAPFQLSFTGGYVGSLSASSQNTWILGEGRGTILVTHNSGKTWERAIFSSPERSVGGWGFVGFTTENEAIALPWTLNGSVIAISHNAGNNWTLDSFPSPRS